MGKQVLLINDLPGYGEVALAVMMPVLTNLSHHVYNLPTAIVSNTLDYGKFEILDTTDYMEKTMKVWEELGFAFDAAATGFILPGRQASLVAGYLRNLKEAGAAVFVDPIMGDEGHLYNGITGETVERMKELAALADYAVPNYTEAAFLTGHTPIKDAGWKDIKDVIDGMRRLGAASVAVTSAFVDGAHAVAGYDAKGGDYFSIPFTPVGMRFAGTGDLFSSVMMGDILSGRPMQKAVARAMHVVKQAILRGQGLDDAFKGIPIEICLDVLRE